MNRTEKKYLAIEKLLDDNIGNDVESDFDFFKKKKYFKLKSNAVEFSMAMITLITLSTGSMLFMSKQSIEQPINPDSKLEKKIPSFSKINTFYLLYLNKSLLLFLLVHSQL